MQQRAGAKALLGSVCTFPEHQWGNPWRNLPETLGPGQSNLTSSLKNRQVAALLRAKSNNEAFWSTASNLWSSGAYWCVCRILWVSEKQIRICFTFSLSNGILMCLELKKATNQRSLKTSQECIFEYRSNCLVPERPNICAQRNRGGELGIAGAHGAVQPDLCMLVTEEVDLHVLAESECFFEWCQVKWWVQWELYTVPLRN